MPAVPLGWHCSADAASLWVAAKQYSVIAEPVDQFFGEKLLHVDTFATHQWHCLPGLYRLKP
jgi:hypothetical protein